MPRAGHHRFAAVVNRTGEKKSLLRVKGQSTDDLEAELQRALAEEKDEEIKRVLQNTVGVDLKDPHKKKVEKDFLIEYLDGERRKVDNCIQLPCTVAFFVSFALAALVHEDVSNCAQLERLWRGALTGTTFEGLGPPVTKLKVSGHKDMGDIDTVADIWTFLHDAILPTLVASDPRSLRRNSDKFRVIRYNHLIGGVQLQQIRKQRRECTAVYPTLGPKHSDSDYNPVLANVYCYPLEAYEDQCFGDDPSLEGFCPDSRILGIPQRRLGEQVSNQSWHWPRRLQFGLDRHAMYAQGQTWEGIDGAPTFGGATYTVFLHPHDGLDVALQKLQSLQDNRWIDDGTAWFGVKLFVMHPDLALYVHIVASVFLSPSGELLPSVRLTSFQAEPYQNRNLLAYDIVFLTLWFYLFCRCVTGLLKATFFGKAKIYVMNFWNVIDWLAALGGIVIIVSWAMFVLQLDELKQRVLDMEAARPVIESRYEFDDAAHKQRYLQRAILLHTEAAGFAGFVSFARIFACNYTIIIIVRFFKAFSIQPRLAIVTNTLVTSLSDIFHFSIVLFLVMASWGTAGMFLFGHRLLEFSEYGFACNTCFLIMMGSYDYAELTSEYLYLGALWFWTYFLFVSLILLNMALAIVLDVYTEVAANAAESDFIWGQAVKVTRFWLERRDWMSYGAVLKHLRKAESPEDGMGVMDICEAIGPDMTMEQATELIQGAEELQDKKLDKGLKMADALRMTAQIKDHVGVMSNQLDLLTSSLVKTRQARRDFSKKMEGRTERGGLVDFGPATKERILALEARFERLEVVAGEAVHNTVEGSRLMRGQLAGVEEALYGPRAPAQRPVDVEPPTNFLRGKLASKDDKVLFDA